MSKISQSRNFKFVEVGLLVSDNFAVGMGMWDIHSDARSCKLFICKIWSIVALGAFTFAVEEIETGFGLLA